MIHPHVLVVQPYQIVLQIYHNCIHSSHLTLAQLFGIPNRLKLIHDVLSLFLCFSQCLLHRISLVDELELELEDSGLQSLYCLLMDEVSI